jgi:C4-dicarboxylate-specific signal transduction histidine kinase
MVPSLRLSENGGKVVPAVILSILLIALAITGCGPAAPPLSPQGKAFRNEVGGIIQKMQQSLAGPVAQNDVPAINQILQGLSKTTAGLCIDCPYRTAVLNKDGILLTTFPNNEMVGRNFSAYRGVADALHRQRIGQTRAYLPDGTKIYFISIPLITANQVVGVVGLALSPADLEKKWHLSEKEFLAINFND